MVTVRFCSSCLAALPLVLLLFIASCGVAYGPSGTPFAYEKTYLIAKGMTSEEVLQIMDSAPHDRLVLGGRETWVWVMSDRGNTKSFAVSFYNEKVDDTFTYVE